MSDPRYQPWLDDADARVATFEHRAGTIYYQESWTALSLVMMTANFIDLTVS